MKEKGDRSDQNTKYACTKISNNNKKRLKPVNVFLLCTLENLNAFVIDMDSGLLVGMQADTAPLDVSMVISQKIRKQPSSRSSNTRTSA